MYWEFGLNFNEFSYTVYEKLLKALLRSRKNICFRDCAAGDPQRSYLILRHDIDFSPAAALRMAEFEANLGVKATYFVLLSSPFYNLLSEEYVEFPRRLTELEHEVGLHYDVKSMERAAQNEDVIDILRKEIDLLTCLTGTDIKSIAMHNPSLSGIDPFKKTSFVNAYDDKYTKQISYFSDSCGAWRDNFIEQFNNNTIPMKMQLLIHPIFWASSPLSRWEILDNLTQDNYNQLLRSNQKVKTMWGEHSGVREHDRRNQSLTNG